MLNIGKIETYKELGTFWYSLQIYLVQSKLDNKIISIYCYNN